MPWLKNCWNAWTRHVGPPEIGRSGTLASVKPRLALLTLGLALFFGAGLAHAEEIYRIEVLVFTHQGGTPDRWPESDLRDFSALPDPLQRAALAAWTARPVDGIAVQSDSRETIEFPDVLSTEPRASGQEAAAGAAPAELSIHRDRGHVPLWPEFFMDLGELSSNMQRAASRLDSSTDHEVLVRLSWLQTLDRRASATAVRIHDQMPLELSWLEPEPSDFVLGNAIIGPSQAPLAHYRLDGSLRLRQRQFRHIELDLVWREPVFNQMPQAGTESARFMIHPLQQSRPIQLGRLEYFDSAWLGVLVLVERWERPALDGATGSGG